MFRFIVDFTDWFFWPFWWFAYAVNRFRRFMTRNEPHVYGLPVYKDVPDYLSDVEVVSRESWGAKPPEDHLVDDLNTPVTAIIIHDTRTSHCYSQEECGAVIRQIQDQHMERDFGDIGYNFLIGGDGRLYEGRGWHKEGAHADCWNSRSFGIAVIGDYKEITPSDEILKRIEQFVSHAVRHKFLAHDYSLMGHNQTDFSPKGEYDCDCPGDGLYEEIKSMPHWVMNEQQVETVSESNSEDDSMEATEWFYTSQYDTESDWPRGYDDVLFGPKDPRYQWP